MNPGFEEVMSIRGRGMPEEGEVTIKGHDPVFSARFKIGEATANILAGVGIAVTDIHEMKTGRRQKVSIDVRHAAATCKSSKVLSQPAAGGGWQPVPVAVHDPHAVDHAALAMWGWPLVSPAFQSAPSARSCNPRAQAANPTRKPSPRRSRNGIRTSSKKRSRSAGVRLHRAFQRRVARTSAGKMLAANRCQITKIGDTDPIPFPAVRGRFRGSRCSI